jgi:hypothetical protein
LWPNKLISILKWKLISITFVLPLKMNTIKIKIIKELLIGSSNSYKILQLALVTYISFSYKLNKKWALYIKLAPKTILLINWLQNEKKLKKID